MAMRFDKIKFNELFKPGEIQREVERQLALIITDHKLQHDKGNAPDGGAQKPYSKRYSEIRANAGLGTETTLQVTGQLLNSRQVKAKNRRRIGGSAEAIFTGDHNNERTARALRQSTENAGTQSNDSIAANLVKRGFKLHYLDNENINALTDQAQENLIKAVRKSIEIKHF